MKYKCNEKGCDQEVEYKPKRVFGLTKPGVSNKKEQEQTITVYLTCSNGHTHTYNVTKG